ncbi:hypothetical protein C4565_05505 [Candidatus Parcubacteria bacterium]|nr:MAG: hypothetical protein C4565_05505 [Candidatus Parcubacteria bacterium]
MNAHKERRTVRRSVALPESLANEAMSVAPPGSEKNFNQVVLLALSEFVSNRKKEAFAQAMERMAADPAIISECAAVSRDFAGTETDGLPDD